MCRPQDILGDPEVRRLIDFSQPVAVFPLAVLHLIPDEAGPFVNSLIGIYCVNYPGPGPVTLGHVPDDLARRLPRQPGLTGQDLMIVVRPGLKEWPFQCQVVRARPDGQQSASEPV